MKKQPLWSKILIKISHCLLALSSAANIIIYSAKDFKFRAILRNLCGSAKIPERRRQNFSPLREQDLELTQTTVLGNAVVGSESVTVV